MTDIQELSKKLREQVEKIRNNALNEKPAHEEVNNTLWLCIELDRLIEVEKVLKAMCGDLRDKFDELRWEEYLSGKGSNILHNTVDEYLERADEIGKKNETI